MTLASAIITRAYRRTNIIPLVATPSTAQQTEALDMLNPIILSTIGYEAGQELRDLNIGGDYDQSQSVATWVPENSRLILNLSSAETLNLDPQPYEGQRLAFADAGNNLATYNLTLDGNGRTIEGSATLTLSTDGGTRQWLYRADTANWVKINTLAASDEMPLPGEFDPYFVAMLAMELNPSYGLGMTAESQAVLSRTRAQIQARYRKPMRRNEPMLGLLHQRRGYYSETSTAFNFGRP